MKWKILKKKKKLTPTDSAVSKLLKKKNVSWVASGEKSFLKDSVLCWFNLTREKWKYHLPISTHTFTRKLSYLILYIADRSSTIMVVNKYLSEAYKKISLYFIPIF